MTTDLVVLSVDEQREKERLERVVDEGKASFVAVGMALAEIKRHPEWYIDAGSFETYAEARFGFKAAHVCRLRKAALIAGSLWGEVSPGKLLLSEPEKTLRPLAKLLDKRGQDEVAPEQRDRIEAAWARACKLAEDEGCAVAGRHAKAAVDDLLGVKTKEKLPVEQALAKLTKAAETFVAEIGEAAVSLDAVLPLTYAIAAVQERLHRARERHEVAQKPGKRNATLVRSARRRKVEQATFVTVEKGPVPEQPVEPEKPDERPAGRRMCCAYCAASALAGQDLVHEDTCTSPQPCATCGYWHSPGECDEAGAA
jgi:hypothetical protein